MVILRTIVRAILVWAVDAAMAWGAATLLWRTAGVTVVSGSSYGLLACLIVVVIGLTLRTVAAGQFVVTGKDTAVFMLRESAILILHAGSLSLAIVLWSRSQDYFLGWVICFSASLLFVGSLWRFIATVLDNRHAANSGRHGHRAQGSPLITLALLRLTSVGIGLLAINFTSPIHNWDVSILSTLIVLLTGATVLSAAIIHFWMSSGGNADRLEVRA